MSILGGVAKRIERAVTFEEAVRLLAKYRHNPGIAAKWNAWVEKNNPEVTPYRYREVVNAVRGTAWRPDERLTLIVADNNKVPHHNYPEGFGQAKV